MINVKEIILFAIFISLTVGSIGIMTATFYVAPMTVYMPYAQAVLVTGRELGGLLALCALIVLFILIKRE